ncbi:hypothetical protein L2E82_16888 [Cichorium intybus]|uniref:Uncharacterized protein n=1 Tax=Cichorium intybus TaxID=13427 RepID=A0ACB9F6E9_CICIN|nr:hypothetical protein L2E82_16888 [Cichorium intybus]
MSMILKLQREKAEIQIEARQFKRFSEEKMAHDQQELIALEELLYRMEQSIQSLTCEVQAYKHRMISYGLTESEVDGGKSFITRENSFATNLETQFDFPSYDYHPPPLKCNSNENQPYQEHDKETVNVPIKFLGGHRRLFNNDELWPSSSTCSALAWGIEADLIFEHDETPSTGRGLGESKQLQDPNAQSESENPRGVPNCRPRTGSFPGQSDSLHELRFYGSQKAEEFAKGKRVVVVGFQKQGLDIAMECSSVNGADNPCTVVYRKDRWKLSNFAPWGIPLQYLYLNRFFELMYT